MSHWPQIHRYAVDHQNEWSPEASLQYYHAWIESLQCSGNGNCLPNWIDFLKMDPQCIVRASQSPEQWFEFFWYAHNHVSQYHAGKPTLSLEAAQKLYGWSVAGNAQGEARISHSRNL